ncbi:MAG TPA: dihydrodipicolinate synthase family protein [Rhodospirillales bacterium]|nr:dihydrodipicolinate synthase family protein [Rhodospirillales bacterium]HIL74496.1 dihydrodipicolinate synthase family protein [Rhodospirillales bacterium]
MKYKKSEAKEYAQEHFRGIFAAGMTPFKTDGSTDEEGLRSNLHHWIDDLGIDGLFINGKQGEFFSMTLAERKRQFEIVIEEVGDSCRTIMSCSDENLGTVLELGRHAQNIGADWIIVHAPPLYFHKNVDAVLKEYYRYIAEQLDIGIAIWHQPDYNYIVEPEVCSDIAKLKNIVAIKYSVDRDRYARLTDMTRGKLIVSTSSEDLWLENITELGWQVYLCSTPPFLMQTKLDQRMNEYTRLAMAGDVAKARVVRDSLNPVREALKNTRPPDKPQAQQKYWADLLGQVGGLVRRPLLNLTDEEKVIVKTAFDTCGLQV